MNRKFIPRDHLTHSLNPYIHKCCGCIHLRAGATMSCLIWAGFSLYLAIISFQSKSPFYSYMDNTALYIFGTINLILFGVSLGTLFPLYLKLGFVIRAASTIINIVVGILLIDMTVNTILFIVRRDGYIQWCINSTSANLDTSLLSGTQQNFNPKMADFYNCNRTWENELKFSVLSTLVMISVYFYWALSLLSYTVKLRMRIKNELMLRMGMIPQMGLMGNLMQPPMNTGADIML